MENKEKTTTSVSERLDAIAGKPRTRREAIIKGILLGVSLAMVTTFTSTEAQGSGS